MKHFLYALMAFCAFGLLSCRKNSDNDTIKQYDANQIQNYITANGLTGMKKDTTAGDTSGIYYQIITPGTGKVINYSDKIAAVYTARSLDGGYSNTDTILNHSHAYAAYVTPAGLQLAIKNILRRKGGKIRVLIPSRLAYGVNGTTISSYNPDGTTKVGTIAGNQGLDYTVSVVDDDITTVNNGVPVNKLAQYDAQSIQSYIKANGLSNYYPVPSGSGVYYKIQQTGTGGDVINLSSTIGVQYTGYLFNGLIFDQANTTDGTAGATFTLIDNIPAWQEALSLPASVTLPHGGIITAGAKISLLCPSSSAYGEDANTSGTVTLPGFSCLRFDINIISVTN